MIGNWQENFPLGTSDPDPAPRSEKCGNCGIWRVVHDGVVEKCPNCGDDEYNRDYALDKGIKKFIIKNMKYVMVAMFTVCMGFLAYLFGILITNQNLSASEAHLTWVACGVLLLAATISISYAARLGLREDKLKEEYIRHQISKVADGYFVNPPPDSMLKQCNKSCWLKRLFK